MKRRMVHGSTFSGIGGPEVAAEMLGWENAFHCEINPFGRRILDYHFPNAKSYEDITTTDFSEWRGKIDVLTGGFPCQPFSYAGKRRGSEDDRYLWPFMLRCIQQVQPTWFVGENVAGITTMAFPGKVSPVGSQAVIFGEGDTIYEQRERYVLDEIIENLERVGYSVQPFIIPACAVGAPHRRDRVFIVAHRDAADTESKQGDGLRLKQSENCKSESLEFRGIDSEDGYLFPENRWRTFPTVSPVHRGNDGFPFNVDDLTIPFSQWKRESLKAYGNAIVPQAIYEIFRAIDEIENNNI